MMKCLATSALALSLMGGVSCSSPSTVSDNTTKVETKTTEKPVAEQKVMVTLEDVINHPRRADDRARDQFRNPLETLNFFEVTPGKAVAEIWPGWYAKILAPYTSETGGSYTAVMLPYGVNDRYDARIDAFKEAYSDTQTFGTVNIAGFDAKVMSGVDDNSQDVILTFRNVHNWMGRGGAEPAFAAFYAALKPGGILGVVEHRLPESAVQDPKGKSGYVQESYMKALAKAAGFEFVASSEINANPRDTADHPYGVWTLPPASRMPKDDDPKKDGFNAELYKNIGESDRATLKFRKPL